MHEYEFRLVVEHPTSFLPLLQSLRYPIREQNVYYMKPHFRFRGGRFETKRVESTHAVYHDGMWFRWVHSVETPYARWSKSTCFTFLHQIGNYQQPLTIERRHLIVLDTQAQLYTFATGQQTYRLVFEWEYGTFSKHPKQWPYDDILNSLSRYRAIYHLLKPYSHPSYKLHEEMSRRPVVTLHELPKENCVYALKLDGTFGIVLSYSDKIKEKWEGNECLVKQGVSLGESGFVYAAERLESGEIYILDVYQVRGHETAPWSRRNILMEFLPTLSLPEGFFIQRYVSDVELLECNPFFKTDGFIAHNVKEDRIFKLKIHHSIDLVYHKGYFYLPNGRFPSVEKNLEEGRVYEISIDTGRVLRLRKDRFKGNTVAQLKSVFQHEWQGPAIEPLPVAIGRKK